MLAWRGEFGILYRSGLQTLWEHNVRGWCRVVLFHSCGRSQGCGVDKFQATPTQTPAPTALRFQSNKSYSTLKRTI